MRLRRILYRLRAGLCRVRRCGEQECFRQAVRLLDAATDDVIRLARHRGALND